VAGDNSKTLVRMANQIADFFKPYGEEQAVAGIQKHIKSFWSPVMRRDLSHYIDTHGGEGLRPGVVAAFHRIAHPEDNPIERATELANETGQMASDAG
jgi:formate dehydrogenase subunit delta